MSPGSAPRPWAGPADAFAFLSRVAPASRAGGLDRALAWFGPVGLVFGAAWTLAAMGAARMAAANPAAPGPWAQGMLAGWVWLLLSVWTTRGLHWDGLADLGDAEGSGARGGASRGPDASRAMPSATGAKVSVCLPLAVSSRTESATRHMRVMAPSCMIQGWARAVTRPSRVMPGGRSGGAKKRTSEKPVTVSQGRSSRAPCSRARSARETGSHGAAPPASGPGDVQPPCSASAGSAKRENWQPP